MELFSLGVGNYTRDRTCARRRAPSPAGQSRAPRRRPRAVSRSGEPVLPRPHASTAARRPSSARRATSRPDDIVDIITEQPASAHVHHAAPLLLLHLPGPVRCTTSSPSSTSIRRAASNIGAVVSAMLHSDVFYSPQAYRGHRQEPGGVRRRRGQGAGPAERRRPCWRPDRGPQQRRRHPGRHGSDALRAAERRRLAGQRAPGSTARPCSRASTSSTQRPAAARTAWQGAGATPQLSASSRRNQPHSPAGPGTTSRRWTHLPAHGLSMTTCRSDARQVLLDYAGGADTKLSPDQLRGLVYLILGSPQFHLA